MRRARRTGPLCLAAALLALAARPSPAPDASPGAAADARAAYETIANELLCYCGCARQTIRECTCGVAFDLRAEFERRLARGESAQAVIAAYIAEHGEQTRNVPPKKGLNLVAWFGPGAGILISGAIVMIVLRRWARRSPPPTPGPVAGGEPASVEQEALLQRVERELKEFES